MVIHEKGLIRAMKEAYKKNGYEIECTNTGGVVEIHIETPTWYVMCIQKNLPRKVLALIVEHMGEIPLPGQAVQVKKKETQTKILNGRSAFCGVTSDDCVNPPRVTKTAIVYRHGNIWHQSREGKIYWVNPDLEEIMLRTVQVVSLGGKTLSVIGNVSSVSIRPTPPLNPMDKRVMEYLADMPQFENQENGGT